MAEITTREEAFAEYQELITKHGLNWTASVPAQAWDTLAETIRWLSIKDRRRAAGLPATSR